MKELVIFVLTLAVFSQGNAKKVCLLYEQKTLSTTSSPNVESVTITEELSTIPEDIWITLGEISSVTDTEISETENVVTEGNSNFTNLEGVNNCLLEGITLFDDQNVLLRKMCAIKPGSSSLYVITVQNSTVKTDLSLETLCAEGPKGLLSWISWQDFIEKVKPVLSTDELPQLVVRNSSIGGLSESETDDDPFSEVLIEMLLIKYRLISMKPSAWINTTFIKTVSLGTIELKNTNDPDQHIDGDLSYSFPIETNITFLSSYPVIGLPVEMSDRIKNFIDGSSNVYDSNNTFSFERLIPALSKEIVSLTGTLGIREYDIEGEIVSIFGFDTDGSSIEESRLIRARVVTTETYDIKDSYSLEDYTVTTTERIGFTTSEEPPISLPHVCGPIYPGLKKYFYLASIVVLVLIFVVVIDVLRNLRIDRIAKSKGHERAYQKIVPKL